MKKFVVWLIGAIMVIAGFLCWDQPTFPSRKVRRETGIQNFRLLESHFTKGDIYVDFRGDETEVRAFEARHPFLQSFTHLVPVLAGKVDPSIEDCATCFYFYEKRPGPYEYILYVISPDHRRVQFYEVYSD